MAIEVNINLVRAKKQLFDKKGIEFAVRAALEATADEVEGLFDEITGEWTTNVPITRSSIKVANDATMEVYADSDVFYWLNFGTGVRHAILSDDWMNKTKVGSYASGPGRGRVVAVSKNYSARGIDARRWTEMMDHDLTPVLFEELSRRLSKP